MPEHTLGQRLSRPAKNLGAVFGESVPDRAAGLAPRPLAPPPQLPVKTTEPQVAEPLAQATPIQPTKKKPPRKPSSKSKNTSKPKQKEGGLTSVRLPVSLKQRLVEVAKNRKVDFAQILISAFESHHSQIPDMFPQNQAGDSSLFPPRAAQRRTRGDDEGGQQVNFTLRPEEKLVIDNLVEQYPQIPHRSALIVRILQAHLS